MPLSHFSSNSVDRCQLGEAEVGRHQLVLSELSAHNDAAPATTTTTTDVLLLLLYDTIVCI